MIGDQRLANYSIVFLALVFVALVLKEFQAFFRPLVIALILTFLFIPMTRWARKRNIPFVCCYAAILVVLAFVISIMAVLLISTGAEAQEALPQREQSFNRVVDYFQDNQPIYSIAGLNVDLREIVNPDKVKDLAASFVSTAIRLTTAIFSEMLLVFFFILFLIPSHHFLIKATSKKPSIHSEKAASVAFGIEQNIKQYLVAKTWISLGTALVSGLLLFFFKSQFVIILALTIFILNYIPNIGSLIAVAITLGLYALSYGLIVQFYFLALLLIATQIFFGYYVEPTFTGNQLKLSPIVILFGLFLWGWMWGVIGMLLSVPLMSVIKIVLEHCGSTARSIAEYMSY